MKRFVLALLLCACGRGAAPGIATAAQDAGAPAPNPGSPSASDAGTSPLPDGGIGGLVPTPVPDPHVLSASEIPAAPQIATACDPATLATTRHPGACSAIGIDVNTRHVTRTTIAWTSDQITAETQESWGSYPSINVSDYQRRTQRNSYDSIGLLQTIGGDDYFDPPYSTSSRSVTDYFYDAAGKLASSAKRSRMQNEGQPSSAERLTETDSYFIDANGKVFITLQEFRDYGRISTDLILYPDGAVRTDAATWVTLGGGFARWFEGHRYDEQGTLLEHDAGTVMHYDYSCFQP